LAGFRGVVVSGDEGLLKPEPAIYRVLFDRYGLDPAACVFVDDSPGNVAAAADLGMHALHFVSAERFAADLTDLGLPVPATLQRLLPRGAQVPRRCPGQPPRPAADLPLPSVEPRGMGSTVSRSPVSRRAHRRGAAV
jgi:hypothetical protein